MRFSFNEPLTYVVYYRQTQSHCETMRCLLKSLWMTSSFDEMMKNSLSFFFNLNRKFTEKFNRKQSFQACVSVIESSIFQVTSSKNAAKFLCSSKIQRSERLMQILLSFVRKIILKHPRISFFQSSPISGKLKTVKWISGAFQLGSANDWNKLENCHKINLIKMTAEEFKLKLLNLFLQTRVQVVRSCFESRYLNI